jgi:membrane-bound lytic murein transglycosylase MltF
MATYQIVRTKKDGPDPDYRIDAFESVDVATDQAYRVTIDSLLRSIDAGNVNFVMVHARRVSVIPKVHPRSGRRYVTTEGDGYPPNNLLNLPNC